MLLAGESSLLDPTRSSTPTSTDSPKHSNFAVTKMQGGKIFLYFMSLFMYFE